MHILDLR